MGVSHCQWAGNGHSHGPKCLRWVFTTQTRKKGEKEKRKEERKKGEKKRKPAEIHGSFSLLFPPFFSSSYLFTPKLEHAKKEKGEPEPRAPCREVVYTTVRLSEPQPLTGGIELLSVVVSCMHEGCFTYRYLSTSINFNSEDGELYT